MIYYRDVSAIFLLTEDHVIEQRSSCLSPGKLALYDTNIGSKIDIYIGNYC
jgi:hypothetical protein